MLKQEDRRRLRGKLNIMTSSKKEGRIFQTLIKINKT